MSWIATGVVLVGVGTAVSAYSTVQAGREQKRQGEFQAKQLEYDRIAQDQEDRESRRRQREANRAALSAIRKDLATSGLAMEGTPLQILSLNTSRMELAVADQYRDALNRSRRMQFNSDFARYQGRVAYSASLLSAGSTVLQGAGTMALGAYSANTTKPATAPAATTATNG